MAPDVAGVARPRYAVDGTAAATTIPRPRHNSGPAIRWGFLFERIEERPGCAGVETVAGGASEWRSAADLLHIVERVHAKGAILHIGNLGRVDPKEPTGALLLNVLGAIAQLERQMMLERQREGIAKAKSEGKYRDRAPA
jgi:hypothetical protein